MKVVCGFELEKHEQLFVARLVDAELVEKIKPGTKKKQVQWATARAVKAKFNLERYFDYCAEHPQAKHKEEVLPFIAKTYKVSPSYIDTALKNQEPKRRDEMERRAAAWARAYNLFLEDWEVNGTPPGV